MKTPGNKFISKKEHNPFGSPMPGRTFSSGSYRYGFNGKEKTDEITVDGGSYDYGFRFYDSRLGRFLCVDPIAARFPELTPYQFASNTPIQAIDLDGLEAFFVHGMGGSPRQWEDRAFSDQAFTLLNYTNNKTFDYNFSWEKDTKGNKLNGPLQTVSDRTIAANMLVDYIKKYREVKMQEAIEKGEVFNEEITLIGFSAGGLVSLQAAEILSKQGYKVNIITYNTPAMNDTNSPENPNNNSGINDMLIINTEGDKLSTKMKDADHSYKKGSIPEKYQQVTVQSKKRNGILKHFVKNADKKSLLNSGAQQLDPVCGKAENP